ncbi:hypothetical protein FRC02_009758 [Tulasnella sp. 418]|nr:hypothetical protein FRC02_009758 [Tulasnella sp. 418]
MAYGAFVSRKRKTLQSKEPNPRNEKLPRIDSSQFSTRVEKPGPSSLKSGRKSTSTTGAGTSLSTHGQPASILNQPSTSHGFFGRSDVHPLNQSSSKIKGKGRATDSNLDSRLVAQQPREYTDLNSRAPRRNRPTSRKSTGGFAPQILRPNSQDLPIRRHTLATEDVIWLSSDDEPSGRLPPALAHPAAESSTNSWHVADDAIIIIDDSEEEASSNQREPSNSVTDPFETPHISTPPREPMHIDEEVHEAEESLENIHIAEPLAKLISPHTGIPQHASPNKPLAPTILNKPMERLSIQPASPSKRSNPTQRSLHDFLKKKRPEPRPANGVKPSSSSEGDDYQVQVRPKSTPIKQTTLGEATFNEGSGEENSSSEVSAILSGAVAKARDEELSTESADSPISLSAKKKPQRGRKSTRGRIPRRASIPRHTSASSDDSDIEFIGFGTMNTEPTAKPEAQLEGLQPDASVSIPPTISSGEPMQRSPSAEESTPPVSSEGPHTPISHLPEEPATPGPSARRAPNLSTAQTISNYASSSRPSTKARYTSLRAIEEQMGIRWINPFDDKTLPAIRLPTDLQDMVNQLPPEYKMDPFNRVLFKQLIIQGTKFDEPSAPEIEIVNDVDDEPCPPFEFVWTNRMLYGEGVPRMNRDLKGCTCIGGKCDPRSKTCACVQRQEFYYKAAGWVTNEVDVVEGEEEDVFNGFIYDERKLLRAHAVPIWECNAACGCSEACQNRVIQNGRKVKLVIKKTRHKGWGVFAGENLEQGTFIGIYSGELIRTQEADLRGQVYDSIGKTYLFDLDSQHLSNGVFHDSQVISSIEDGNKAPESMTSKKRHEVKYSVDAFHAGNHTRFFNHSCEPNIDLNHCYTFDADVEKPLLCAFTNQHVLRGQELCFSYHGIDQETAKKMRKKRSRKHDNNTTTEGRCMCMSKNCLGFVFRQGYMANGEDDSEDDGYERSDSGDREGSPSSTRMVS